MTDEPTNEPTDDEEPTTDAPAVVGEERAEPATYDQGGGNAWANWPGNA